MKIPCVMLDAAANSKILQELAPGTEEVIVKRYTQLSPKSALVYQSTLSIPIIGLYGAASFYTAGMQLMPAIASSAIRIRTFVFDSSESTVALLVPGTFGVPDTWGAGNPNIDQPIAMIKTNLNPITIYYSSSQSNYYILFVSAVSAIIGFEIDLIQ